MERINRLNKDKSENLFNILKENLEKHKDLSRIFDCYIIDLDIYYKYELYKKSNSSFLTKVVTSLNYRYSYFALYDDKPVRISHGTSEKNLEKILKEQRLIAGDRFNYGIWFTEIGTGYYWDFPKYINLTYNKPTLRIIESTDELMVDAIGCIITCEEEIDLTQVEYTVTDEFDKTINLEIAHQSLGLPRDLRELKILQLVSLM